MNNRWDASRANDFPQKCTLSLITFDTMDLCPVDGGELHRQNETGEARAGADVQPSNCRWIHEPDLGAVRYMASPH